MESALLIDFFSIQIRSNQYLLVQKEQKKKKLIFAMDIIHNDCLNSRKSNTVNAFALPISEGNVPLK